MMPGAVHKSPKRRGRSGMSTQEAAWLAWYICAVSLMMTSFGLFFLAVSKSRMDAPVFDYWLLNTVIAVSFSPVGAVIAPRLPPRNPIGWLFCTIGFIGALRLFVAEYAIATLLAEPGGAGRYAAESAAWGRGAGVDLFLGVGRALWAFHIPGAALPRR